jgi:23S rRNA-intervening sequence protein
MSYREQFIWQRSVDLSVKCYELTRHFPQSEIYGLTSQTRRSAVPVASNIASKKAVGRRQKDEQRKGSINFEAYCSFPSALLSVDALRMNTFNSFIYL